eukprot:6064500-Amphidinium_carterae.1
MAQAEVQKRREYGLIASDVPSLGRVVWHSWAHVVGHTITLPTAEPRRQHEEVEVADQAGSRSAPTLDEGNSSGSIVGSRLPGRFSPERE